MINTAGEGGFFPTPAQTLLLKASIFPPEEAIVYWRQWIKAMEIDKDDIDDPDFVRNFYESLDGASRRTLPMIWKNLGNSDDEYIIRLKRTNRQVWVKNQMLIAGIIDILDALGKAGIDHMILKGIPLGLRYYEDASVRIAADGDVYIPYEKKQKALKILTAPPFSYRISHMDSTLTDYLHAAHIVTGQGLDIDLHWNIFGEHTGKKDIDKVFWSKREPFELNDFQTHVLSPTHQFFSSMIHGRYYDTPSPIRWINDCFAVTRKSEVDWKEIIDLAVHFHFVPFTREALKLLKNEFEMDIPGEYIAELENLEISVYEEQYQDFAGRKFQKGSLIRIFKRMLQSPIRRYAYFQIFRKGYDKYPFPLWYLRWGIKKTIAWVPDLWRR